MLNRSGLFSLFVACALTTGAAFAAQAPNPRAATTVAVAPGRTDANTVKRVTLDESVSSRGTASRSAAIQPVSSSRSAAVTGPQGVVSSRSATRQAVVNNKPSTSTARVASTSAARSAVSASAARSAATPNVARSATSTVTVSNASRARATAVFDDVSKMGSGYSACRESYNTCMDQFCAKSNETYRRCFCSDRYTEFQTTEAALDQAKTLLMQFEDNNLNAVDKTAAEVTAMYSATVGEQAIKNDPSAAQKTLDSIADLLSGKTPVSKNNTSRSLGVIDLDFSSDLDDIWSGGSSSSSIFGGGSGVDLSSKEGVDLYNEAHKQCLALVGENCGNTATITMVKSAYNILITQDCNAYQKKVDAQKQAVADTVRTAEKYLREARLEEYRTHNSADVNECITKVKTAITGEMACGPNYKKCLDYTGQYVDVNSGDPIYSTKLFEMTSLINLSSSSDVVGTNPKFSQFLDTKKMFAENALDTCRDKATVVWNEFKRSAIIEIAQAQDSKIEEVKNSCVSTMKECYDTQTGALADFDNTTAQASGALNAYAAKAMCKEKVEACSNLYGNLNALLTFVETVDTVRVAEGCASAIDGYVEQLCTPTAGDMGYPWNCRNKALGDERQTPTGEAAGSIAQNVMNFAVTNCSDPDEKEKTYARLPVQTQTQIIKAVQDIGEQLEYQLMETCEELEGFWLDKEDESGKLLQAFYTTVYGGKQNMIWGRCVENDVMVRCLAYNSEDAQYASYNASTNTCTFTTEWFKNQCLQIGGYWENNVCYVAE